MKDKGHQNFELALNETKYKQLIDNLNDLIIQFDTDYKITYLSPAYIETFGLDESELIGKDFFFLIHERDREWVKKSLKLLFKPPYHTQHEERVKTKDGWRWFSWSGKAILSTSGVLTSFISIGRDITDKKNALNALHESEAKLNAVLKSIEESIWSVNTEYRILTMNHTFKNEFRKYIGVELKNGMAITNHLPPTEKEKWINRYQQAFEGKVVKEIEEYDYPEGKRSFDIRVNPILEQGKITGASVITHDISEQFRSKELIKQSEEKFRLLAGNMIDLVALHAPSGDYIYLSPSITKILGYSENDLIGTSPYKLFHPDDRDRITSSSHKPSLGGKDIGNIEYRIRKKSGEYVWFQTSTKPILNKKNEVINLQTISRDITERKRSDQIRKVLYEISRFPNKTLDLKSFLSKLHQQVNTILKARNFYASLYDFKTDTYTFPYYEDETEEYENLTPIKLKDSLTDFVRREGKGKLLRTYEKGEVIKAESISTYGTPAKVWMGAPMISGSSKEVIGVIVVQDYQNNDAYNEKDLVILEIIAFNIGVFVERIQNHNALKKAKTRAEESDRLKSAFLANMSHEIRTPMNGILGFADLLKEPDLSGDEQKQYVGVIEKSGERMLNIINDLIDISKIEAGQMELIVSAANINDQIDFLYTFFNPEAKSKNISLSYSKTLPNELAAIITDREKLYAILTNLLKNAIKFTSEGKIEYGYVLKKDPEPAELEFFVKDTGLGIAKDRQQAIFERFVQADLKISKPYEGAGLGLAITKAYVEMLGGKIWIESDLGKGSTFYFTLPYHTKASHQTTTNQQSTTEKQENIYQNLNILVAEDDETAFLYLEALLASKCKKLSQCTTGLEVVETCRQNPDIDLILMDIKMPKMDGYTATREIRKFNKDVIIVAQTAYALSGDREKALEAGCNDYISKPVKAKSLNRLISNHF